MGVPQRGGGAPSRLLPVVVSCSTDHLYPWRKQASLHHTHTHTHTAQQPRRYSTTPRTTGYAVCKVPLEKE